jgi:hypothetical protein
MVWRHYVMVWRHYVMVWRHYVMVWRHYVMVWRVTAATSLRHHRRLLLLLVMCRVDGSLAVADQQQTRISQEVAPVFGGSGC